jgi:hypothetical protein
MHAAVLTLLWLIGAQGQGEAFPGHSFPANPQQIAPMPDQAAAQPFVEEPGDEPSATPADKERPHRAAITYVPGFHRYYYWNVRQEYFRGVGFDYYRIYDVPWHHPPFPPPPLPPPHARAPDRGGLPGIGDIPPPHP